MLNERVFPVTRRDPTDDTCASEGRRSKSLLLIFFGLGLLLCAYLLEDDTKQTRSCERHGGNTLKSEIKTFQCATHVRSPFSPRVHDGLREEAGGVNSVRQV